MSKQKPDIVKDLKPRDTDCNLYGPEPNFYTSQPNPNKRQYSLGQAFNWYDHFYGRKESKEFFIEHLERNGISKESIKLIQRGPDSKMSPGIGWLCRLTLRGLELNEHELEQIKIATSNLIAVAKQNITDEDIEGEKKTNRPNVQEIMRERTLNVGGELEGLWDEYLNNGAKKETIKTVDILAQSNILPQHVHLLTAAWNQKLDEYSAVIEANDEQLNDAYSRFGKIQLRNIVSAIETVISDLNAYINIKKAGRKPRAKKSVPVEKVVRKLKYLKTFKLDKTDIESVSPTKLHGCNEAWIYDTKKRKLHHYVADEYTKTLGVKGNTVGGFCTKGSKTKTLRKPESQIKEIMGSKPKARKFFDDIKAVETTPNGRFNENMIILRAF
jgi:hypothetical protein